MLVLCVNNRNNFIFGRIRGPPVLVWDFLISNQKTGGFYNEKI
jgi:hypothetical protein